MSIFNSYIKLPEGNYGENWLTMVYNPSITMFNPYFVVYSLYSYIWILYMFLAHIFFYHD